MCRRCVTDSAARRMLNRRALNEFATHRTWLPAGRWVIECFANLDRLPAGGAMPIVGAPKFRGGTGGQGRVLALL